MKESAGVRGAIHGFYEAFGAGASDRFDELVSENATTVIGTAPHEWIDDRETMRSQFGMEGITLAAGDTKAWEDGAVGWFADRPSFVMPDGMEIETRLTGVVLREADAWKITQLHFSIGIPDDEAAAAA